MKRILLSRGNTALVDDEDYDFLNHWKWTTNKLGYPQIGVRYKKLRTTVLMHRLIMDADVDEKVDHIDGNPLNNCRSNLRLCTQAQNQHNRGRNRKSTSGYKGVFKSKNRWRAMITVDYQPISLGCYATPEEAADAYDAAAIRYFGEFARLNNAC